MAHLPSAVSTSAWVINEQGSGKPPDTAAAGAAGAALEPGLGVELEQEAKTVLGLVFRAQNVFGGDTAPTLPPDFAANRRLEDNLGRGYF